MASTVNQNFSIHKSDNRTVVFTMNATADLSGGTVVWKAKTHQLNTATPDAISKNATVDTATQFTVLLVPADTVNLKPGVYHHKAIATVSTIVSTVAQGYLTIHP